VLVGRGSSLKLHSHFILNYWLNNKWVVVLEYWSNSILDLRHPFLLCLQINYNWLNCPKDSLNLYKLEIANNFHYTNESQLSNCSTVFLGKQFSADWLMFPYHSSIYTWKIRIAYEITKFLLSVLLTLLLSYQYHTWYKNMQWTAKINYLQEYRMHGVVSLCLSHSKYYTEIVNSSGVVSCNQMCTIWPLFAHC